MVEMKIETFTYECSGCGKCAEQCPRGVLKMVDNGLCRFVNVADESLCKGCRRCEKACTRGAIQVKETDKDKKIKFNIMKKKFRVAAFAIGGLALMAGIVAAIMGLWNYLMPEITGWNPIGYWQALGLAVLFRLLTGHPMPLFPHGRHRRIQEKMRAMSATERKAFIRRQLSKLSTEGTDHE